MSKQVMQRALDALEGADAIDTDMAAAIAELRAALDAPVEPVTDDVVAGALFDFLGYLTSRSARITMSATDNACAAVDALVDWSKTRKINLDEARVKDWNIYTAPPDTEGLRRDAERYRLLRRGQHWSVVNGIGDTLRAHQLDSSIDAAIAAQGVCHD
jgi:hypothetical protein